jgi:hypothetical protein
MTPVDLLSDFNTSLTLGKKDKQRMNMGGPLMIEKIKNNLKADSVPYDTVSQDIITLVKMTREK